MMLLAPWFLGGLLAIGLPLWLHRFSKQTQERQPFASLMLIEPSNIQRSHKHTLKYLMLLALRIALIAAIAFSFAELVLPWRAPPLEASGRTLHVIVLDTSLSMQEGERWKRATERARELIDAMAPGDQGMLVAADSRIRVVGKPVEAGSRQSLIAALEATRPGYARLDYGMLMTSATSWIGTDRLATRLHLITDLQQSASPLRFADLEPPRGVQLSLINVAEQPAANLFVKSVAPSPQNASILEARIGGVMPPGTRREVILTINGEERARRPLGELTNGEARVAFSDLDLKEGEHRVVVSLEPQDTMPQDDRFYAVLERNQSRALIVTADSKGNDASYLAAAVGSLTNPRFEVESVAADSIDQRKIADYSAVIVSDVGILSESAARAIQEYVEAGGAVLMTLGPRAATMNTFPLSGHTRLSTVSGSSAERPVRVSNVEVSHPALRDAQGWRSVRFFRYVPIQTGAGDSVLIRFEQGDPLLVERRAGGGRLLVLTSPLDREWNDLAIHPLFVRFIGEATRYLTGATQTPNATVGTLLPTAVSGRTGAQVFDPRGQRVLPLSDTAGAARLMAEQTGFYEVRGGGRSDWVAANVDPRESDLTPLSQESIERWQRLQSNATAAQDAAATVSAQAESAPQMKSIWPWILLLAVTLAFVEPVVANSYLHVRRGVPT
jgi:hypothetical protein